MASKSSTILRRCPTATAIPGSKKLLPRRTDADIPLGILPDHGAAADHTPVPRPVAARAGHPAETGTENRNTGSSLMASAGLHPLAARRGATSLVLPAVTAATALADRPGVLRAPQAEPSILVAPAAGTPFRPALQAGATPVTGAGAAAPPDLVAVIMTPIDRGLAREADHRKDTRRASGRPLPSARRAGASPRASGYPYPTFLLHPRNHSVRTQNSLNSWVYPLTRFP